MVMELVLRFDYGRSVPWVTSMDDGSLRAIAGPDMVVLRTSVPLKGENLKTRAEFTIREGESIPFVLTYGPSYEKLPHPIEPEKSLQYTIEFWEHWTSRSKLHGEYAPQLERSLITSKALLSSHRRDGCRPYYIAARTPGRRAELGLPLLLASRCHIHVAGPDECRLLRGGTGLARLAAARRRGQSRPGADHVWNSGRAEPDGVGGAVARRL